MDPQTYSFSMTYDILSSDKYRFDTKIHTLWYFYQHITLLPMLYFSLVRFRKQIANEEYIEPKKEFKSYKIDSFVRFYTFIYFIFYFITILFSLRKITSPCKALSVAHHLVSLYGAVNFMKIKYFPWFTLLPLALHSALLTFPKYTSLNYIYIISILICYYGLTQRPWNGRPGYQGIKYFIIGLIFPLLGIWWLNCHNVLILK